MSEMPRVYSSRRVVLTYSVNTTVKGSKGLITTSDQAYTSLPADSRQPAAPIDPSSECCPHIGLCPP